MIAPPQWFNALSTRPSLEGAIAEVVDRLGGELQGRQGDLGLLFISSAFASDYSRVLPLLLERFSLPVLVGCGGGGIVGHDANRAIQEVEEGPALSLSVLCLGDRPSRLHPFYVTGEELPDLDSAPRDWVDLVGIDPAEQPHFLLLADPIADRLDDLLAGLDFAYPGLPKVGGLASGGTSPLTPNLFWGGTALGGPHLRRGGVIGVGFTGDLGWETIVAQGCRPIADPYYVDSGERNIITALRATTPEAKPTPPLTVLQHILQDLQESDRQLAQHSLFIGMARDSFKQQLGPGDFLVRNVLGVDPRGGAMAIGDRVRSGQRIQFHLRDAQTSAEDLAHLLTLAKQEEPGDRPIIGALMFSCLGRGLGLYGQANFDSRLLAQHWPGVTLSGFFCNGEIGPVAGGTFLHGYTSVFALLRSRSPWPCSG